MYSAATGKDWGTGRELDTTERSLRAGFALFDIVPGVGYASDLAKSGSKRAAKEFLQTSIQKGFIQGAKNLDSFKSLVHNIGQFGDKLLRNVDNYAKQIDTILAHKVASAADTLAGKLRHIDGALSEAAQNFRLNIGMEPQLASGALPPSGAGKLSQAADNLHAFAKSLDGSVDEVGEAGNRGSRLAKQFKNQLQLDVAQAPNWVEEAREIVTDGSHMDGKYPKPNMVYQTGEHLYLYRTDEFGRIDRAYAENLQLKLHDKRLSHKRQTLDKRVGDHAGHIFGDLFGGSPELDNLLSQAKEVNLKEYRRIERDWADALRSKPSKKVEGDIKINYDGISKRPISFEVNYKIDGEPYSEILKNINRR